METNKLSDGVSTFEPLETSLSLDSTKCHYPHLVPFLDIKNVSPSGIHIPHPIIRSQISTNNAGRQWDGDRARMEDKFKIKFVIIPIRIMSTDCTPTLLTTKQSNPQYGIVCSEN